MGLVDPARTQPHISVIVPVYNRANLVERALQSLIEQAVQHPYEIIVVDDGSTDGSAEIAQRLDTRIRVLRQTNQKAHQARINGAEAARGKLLAFLDSDDEAKPYHLAAHYQAVSTFPQAVLSFGMCHQAHSSEKRSPLHCPTQDQIWLLEEPLEHFFRYGGFIDAMNVMMKREDFLEFARSTRGGSVAQDTCMFLQAALRGPFVGVGLKTVLRNLQPDSLSVQFKGLQDAACLQGMIDTYHLSPISGSAESTRLLRMVVKRYAPSGIVGLILQRRWNEVQELLHYVPCGLSFSFVRNFVRSLCQQTFAKTFG